jgi:hypothetical protein
MLYRVHFITDKLYHIMLYRVHLTTDKLYHIMLYRVHLTTETLSHNVVIKFVSGEVCSIQHYVIKFVSGEVYSIQHYVYNVIKFVSDLWQIGGFLRFPPPLKKNQKTLIFFHEWVNQFIKYMYFYMSVLLIFFSVNRISLKSITHP